MDGSKGGYGSAEATKDWGNEYGPNSEWNNRVGDTCYWKDRDGPRKPGDPEDCSHSFHPEDDRSRDESSAIESSNSSKRRTEGSDGDSANVAAPSRDAAKTQHVVRSSAPTVTMGWLASAGVALVAL
eukprot:TRINITY_DN20693_c0_g1_i1.p1 TRINITY_DN20693_c0_g1~~TRINITY_DN20693_c0_g1_i1.p1  ORF type:complete len:127 (+),score=24.84 TRINITY_DN20693_c0_g1_i1:122-502(+)